MGMNQAIFQQIEDVIQTIPHEVVNESHHTFTFNRMYRAYMSEDSVQNIPKLFGASLWWRLKKYAKKIRKKVTLPESISLSLPKDSIIFVRPQKNGIIAISYQKNVNIKVILDTDFLFMLQYEVDALNVLKGRDFAPQIKGASLEGNYWLVTDCSVNSTPLLMKPKPEDYVLNHFEELLLPKMSAFYQDSLYKKENFLQWIDRSQERIKNHPSKDKLQSYIDKLKKLPVEETTPFLMSSMIHFDLHAGNILSDEGKLTIVDWEGGARGLVMMDFFYLAKRIIKADRKLKKKFLEGNLDIESLKIANVLYMKWLKNSFGLELNRPLSLDVFSMTSLLEQALVLYEDRRIDIVAEDNGFECHAFI